jgi:hypothetical protein
MGDIISHFAAAVSSALWQAVPHIYMYNKQTNPTNKQTQQQQQPCIVQIVNQPSVSGFIDSVTSFCFQLHTLYILVHFGLN